MRPSTLVPGLIALSAAALAQPGYEGPGSFKASQVLPPELRKGPHFEVQEQVSTPGYFHEFRIRSDFGEMQAEGISLLRTRLNEVDALARLQDVSKTEVFLSAAGNSVLNVGKGVVNVVADPADTVKGVGAGIKRFGTNLGRKAKRGTSSSGDSDQKGDKSTADKAAEAGSDLARSALGVNGGMRRWAQKLQVDPYTTNPVLRKALEDVAKIDAAGGIAAKVAVPVPGIVGATASVGNLVWGQDPEALLKLNEQRLAELGADKQAAGALFRSKAFRLGYLTRFVAALHAVKAPGCGAYADTASEAESETQALFFTESAELLQRLHQSEPVEKVLADSRALIAKTRDGRAVALLPLDSLRWTEAFANAVKQAGARARAELGAKSLELRLSGRVSDRARQELKALGWSVVESLQPAGPAS